MRNGTIVAIFAAGLTLGAALPLLGQVSVPILVSEIYGLPSGGDVYVVCTDRGGAPITGGIPVTSIDSVSRGGVTFTAARIRCG